MNSAENDREQRIRASVIAERPLVAALANQVTDAYLKQILQLASHWLDDVENLLLPSAVKAFPAHYASAWLDMAEFNVKDAARRRQFVQDIVAKYGADAQSVP
jgi:hypothetical protein